MIMGKYEKKKKKRNSFGRIALVMLIAVLVATLVLFVMPQVLHRLRGEDATDVSGDTPQNTITAAESGSMETLADPTAPTVEMQNPVTFPLDVEEGKLQIENLLPFDGWNPDCGDQSGTNIAAIVVTNLSDTYLIRSDISITTSDGRVLNFVLTDIPAGSSVMAFDTGNATVGIHTTYGDPVCRSQFGDSASPIADGITVSVAGSHITLQNNTEEDISNLVVYCHGLLGNQFFGGITYINTVNTLTVGGTAELDVQDCTLGLVEVVRITTNEP